MNREFRLVNVRLHIDAGRHIHIELPRDEAFDCLDRLSYLDSYLSELSTFLMDGTYPIKVEGYIQVTDMDA